MADLVMADDLEQLAFDDREAVREYRQKTLGIKTTKEGGINRRTGGGSSFAKQVDDVGHILGDVTIEQPPNKNPLSSMIVPLATLAVLGGLGWKLLDGWSNKSPDTDNVTNITPGFGDPNKKD